MTARARNWFFDCLFERISNVTVKGKEGLQLLGIFWKEFLSFFRVFDNT